MNPRNIDRSWIVSFFVVGLLSMQPLLLQGAEPVAPSDALPKLVDSRTDDPKHPRGKPPEYFLVNQSGMEPRINFEATYNREIIAEIEKRDSPATRTELKRRLTDEATAMTVRLLYANILAGLSDEAGREFLLKTGRTATDWEVVQNVFQLTRAPWAEAFMLEMLKEPKGLTREGRPPPYPRQSLAMDESFGGNFGQVLAGMKTAGLYDVLVALWRDTPGYMRRYDIMHAFEALGDRRVIPLLLDVLRPEWKEESDTMQVREGEYNTAAGILANWGVAEAIPILLEHMSHAPTYYFLAKYQDARILPAIKKALPGLKGQALDAARLAVVHLEGGDILPKLLELTKDPSFNPSLKYDLDREIAGLKDKRAVTYFIAELNTSPKLYSRLDAIRFLGSVKDSPEAIQALAEALDMNFQALAEGKEVMGDNDKATRVQIVEELKRLTGRDFGVSKQKWLDYCRKTWPPGVK
jgi:PBS lyase HEAT-like repeat